MSATSSPPPTDGLPRPTNVNKSKSHPMSTRSAATPSPANVDSEGSWPTPAEAAHVKSIKHNKGNLLSPKRSPKANPLSPNKTPQQSRTAQEPKSVVSEERRRQKVSLFESRFLKAKQFMDEIHGSTPSIAALTIDEFLDEFCQPKGVLLRIFVEKILGRMHVNLKASSNAMQNAIYFMSACSELGVSVDISLNTTDILHRRISPIVNNILAIRDIYEARNRDLDTFSEACDNATMNPMLDMFNQENVVEDSVACAEPPTLMPITPKAIRPVAPLTSDMATEEGVDTPEAIPLEAASPDDVAIAETVDSVVVESEVNSSELEANASVTNADLVHQVKALEEAKIAMELNLAEKKKIMNSEAGVTRQCLKDVNCNMVKSSITSELASCANDVGGLMATLMSGVKSQVQQAKDTEECLSKEIALRKKLFNQIQEMNGNIRVFVRVRPSNKTDEKAAVTITKDGDLSLDMEAGLTVDQSNAAKATGRTIPPKVAEFDHVLGQTSTQEEMFAKACPLVTSVMDGWHASILAYGQTGSGKTFTMDGIPGNEGVNVRALRELFRIKQEKESSGIEKVEVTLSMVEIYNEQVKDLLDSSGGDTSCEIRMRSAIEGGGVYLPKATIVNVSCIDDVDQAMAQGKANRSTGSTKANQHSSRSHSVLMVDVKVQNVATGLISAGRLSLVDLAGSERIAKTGATGDTLKEAQAINKSLSALGNVIGSLSAKQQKEKSVGHIPYRDSKLTHLLQDSLGDGNKTMLIVQVSPDAIDIQETSCSVNFGARARNVELGSGSGGVNGGGSSKSSKGGVAKQAQVEAMVSKVNKEKASLESKLLASEAKCKALEKALEEEKQNSNASMAALKSSKLEMTQVNESSKKSKSQSEIATKKTEYQLKIVTDKLEKMEKENKLIVDEKKKCDVKMKKLEEELAALKATVKKESNKTKKPTSTSSAPAPLSPTPYIEPMLAPVCALPVVEESAVEESVVEESIPVLSFAEIAASPPKLKTQDQENLSPVQHSSPMAVVFSKSVKTPKAKGVKKVCFLSPPPRSPLAASTVTNQLVSNEVPLQGKFRTTPHKEKPSLQEATTSSMKSIMAKTAPLVSSSSGASRVSVTESKKGALSKGAQRISFSGGGGGSSRRSSVSAPGSRWH